jgi:tRNA threonylcarbamoyl adenosine modification protein YeaZ
MKTLALEFSSPQRSVAVAEVSEAGARLLGQAIAQAGTEPGPLALVQDALRAAGVGRAVVECIAVGLGPGSYTGIRMAIALAQGWQLARGVRLLGVSSADALARAAWRQGRRGKAQVLIDAQRGEFCHGGYELRDADVQLLSGLKILQPEAVDRDAGALLVTEATPDFADVTVTLPTAEDVAILTGGRRDFTPGEMLEPVYLRAATFAKASPPSGAVPPV